MNPHKKARRDQDGSPKKSQEVPLWALKHQKDAEEEQLEDIVFGGAAFKQTVQIQDDDQDDLTGMEHVPDSQLFFFDDGKEQEEDDSSSEEDDNSNLKTTKDSSRLQATKPLPQRPTTKSSAWADPDDEELRVSIASDKRLRKLRVEESEDVITGNEYENRLRRQFESINPVPQWAATARRKRRRDEMELDDRTLGLDSLLNSTSAIAKSSSRHELEKGTIDIERLRDANQASKTEGDVKSVAFHPSPAVSVMLSAGGDRRLKLYTVDGHTNPLLQTVHVPSLPISTASFHPSGSHVLLTGPRPFFFNYDLQSGICTKSPRGLWGTFASKVDNADHSLEKNSFSPDGRVLAVAGRRGYVYLVEWTTGSPQVVSSLKMNTGVRSLWWNTKASVTEARELYTLGDNSEVYVWDVRSRNCLRRWKDDGQYGATHITGSGQGDYLAIGSKSGIVNLYGSNVTSGNTTNTKPLKAFGNLTTAISCLDVNHNSEMMVMASSIKKDQLRLVHLASLSVFSNWPTSSSPLGKVTATAFSQGSEYLAIGNSRGRVLLYGLRHFWSTT